MLQLDEIEPNGNNNSRLITFTNLLIPQTLYWLVSSIIELKGLVSIKTLFIEYIKSDFIYYGIYPLLEILNYYASSATGGH